MAEDLQVQEPPVQVQQPVTDQQPPKQKLWQ